MGTGRFELKKRWRALKEWEVVWECATVLVRSKQNFYNMGRRRELRDGG